MLENRTTVKLTNDIAQKIDFLAEKLGTTKSGVIRMAIVYYLIEWDGVFKKIEQDQKAGVTKVDE
jgi:predicted transcriptional regulator